MAVLSLLLAFNVPQATVDNVQSILLKSADVPISTSFPQAPVDSGGIIMSMKPAYTLDQIEHLFNQMEKDSTGGSAPFAPYRYVPVIAVNPTATSITVGLNGYATKNGEIWFNGQKLETQPTSYAAELADLTPGTIYTYTFKWKEEGREDTSFDFTFRTLYR